MWRLIYGLLWRNIIKARYPKSELFSRMAQGSIQWHSLSAVEVESEKLFIRVTIDISASNMQPEMGYIGMFSGKGFDTTYTDGLLMSI